MRDTIRAKLKLALDRALAIAFDRSDLLKRLWARTLKTREGEIPFARISSLSRARLALVTTGGFHARQERPFDMSDARGDPSFREIDLEAPPEAFVITHDYYDHKDAEEDRNVIFPVERAKELVEEGVLGSLSPKGYSFMGHLADDTHIPAMEESAREVARRMRRDHVTAALITPAWGSCNRAAARIALQLEAQGIATVTLSIVREVTERERPPRAVFVRYPFGHPLGQKGDIPGQRRVLLEALKVLLEASTPGAIIDLPFRWRRTDFAALPPLELR